MICVFSSNVMLRWSHRRTAHGMGDDGFMQSRMAFSAAAPGPVSLGAHAPDACSRELRWPLHARSSLEQAEAKALEACNKKAGNRK